MCARNLALEEGGGSSTCSSVGGQHGELEVWTEKGDCQEVTLQRVLYKQQPEDVSTLLLKKPVAANQVEFMIVDLHACPAIR